MGHGLGAIREMRLDAYAERFAQAGCPFGWLHETSAQTPARALTASLT
jgi:hypothetical protein